MSLKPIVRPKKTTLVEIKVNGKSIELPSTPIRSTNANGITRYDLYEVKFVLNTSSLPVITASANDSKSKD